MYCSVSVINLPSNEQPLLLKHKLNADVLGFAAKFELNGCQVTDTLLTHFVYIGLSYIIVNKNISLLIKNDIIMSLQQRFSLYKNLALEN